MNYITEGFDFSLLQFGPLNMTVREVSIRGILEAFGKAAEEFRWALAPESILKDDLKKQDLLKFFTGEDCADQTMDVENFDLLGFNAEDQIIAVVRCSDSHLTVAQNGFRFFLITFEKREITAKLFIDGKQVDYPKVTE